MSLSVYLRQADIPTTKKTIMLNDAVFDKSLLSANSFSGAALSEIKSGMRMIDGAEFVNKKDMRDRFGNLTSIQHLSTGCKSLINCIHYPQCVVSCVECGRNVLQIVLHRNTGNILLRALPKNDNQGIDIDLHIANKVEHYTDMAQFIKRCDEVFRSVGY